MTGRRLYDKFTDAAAESKDRWNNATHSVLPCADAPALAWAFLGVRDRDVWNELARRITPTPKAKA